MRRSTLLVIPVVLATWVVVNSHLVAAYAADGSQLAAVDFDEPDHAAAAARLTVALGLEPVVTTTGAIGTGCDERPSDCPASWRNYGAGWPGTAGIPALAPSADPVLGTTIDLDVGNSAGVDTVAVVFAGLSAATLATSWDGTLLVAPSWVVPIALPAAGAALPLEIPDDPAICGLLGFVQALELDGGASDGVAFTEGLELTLGQ